MEKRAAENAESMEKRAAENAESMEKKGCRKRNSIELIEIVKYSIVKFYDQNLSTR